VAEVEPNSATVPARVKRVIHLGWEIQAELALEDGQEMVAHITRDRFDQLNLVENQRVHIKPKGVRSFALDYSI
jgi:sulfate/thiosulfate transport system ATP-binding protein